ncbi:MAG: DUF4838 domain-containing protein [Treponema sp.]|jgi:hypothetical protein|nr:DUF4838 domain-containing protein [Treponema sp.]
MINPVREAGAKEAEDSRREPVNRASRQIVFLPRNGYTDSMICFDVSRTWTIILPLDAPAALKGGEELSLAIERMRILAGLTIAPPVIADASGASPEGPLIVLNAERGGRRNGFSWRLGQERLEIYGDSGRGLCNGIFHFLAALGMRWPSPGAEGEIQAEFPENFRRNFRWEYVLRNGGGHKKSDPGPARRIVFTGKESPWERKAAIVWAARNQIDAVVFPLVEINRAFTSSSGTPAGSTAGSTAGSLESSLLPAASYDLAVERGGWELSRLLPRRYFLFHRELFRMERGKRVKEHHFCPTNPDTIVIARAEAERLFRAYPDTGIFHLWPDEGFEYTWCACPTCRAFSPEEQNRIAVNIAAEALAGINPQARLSYYESAGEGIEIETRPNMFKLDQLPGTAVPAP